MGFVIYCILLGTVQGLTEFLPVSSSGHLVLLERLLGVTFSGGSMTFLNLMLHLGTLFAVVFAYRKELLALFRQPKRILLLGVATVPAAAVGLLFGDAIDALFAGPRGIFLLCLCFGATACLLLACGAKKRRKKTFGWGQALSMGLMQAVAVFPGISRSGSTIAVGTLAGADSEEAATFSFLMSIPVILGGFAVGLAGALTGPTATDIGAAEVCGVLLGVLLSACTGFLSLRLMKKLAKNANYQWFALYLLILAIAVLILDLAGCV